MANSRILSTIHLPNFVENGGPVVEIWRGEGGGGGGQPVSATGACATGFRAVSGVRVAVQLIPCMIPCMNATELNPPLLITTGAASTSALCRALHCTVYR